MFSNVGFSYGRKFWIPLVEKNVLDESAETRNDTLTAMSDLTNRQRQQINQF